MAVVRCRYSRCDGPSVERVDGAALGWQGRVHRPAPVLPCDMIWYHLLTASLPFDTRHASLYDTIWYCTTMFYKYASHHIPSAAARLPDILVFHNDLSEPRLHFIWYDNLTLLPRELLGPRIAQFPPRWCLLQGINLWYGYAPSPHGRVGAAPLNSGLVAVTCCDVTWWWRWRCSQAKPLWTHPTAVGDDVGPASACRQAWVGRQCDRGGESDKTCSRSSEGMSFPLLYNGYYLWRAIPGQGCE